MVTQDEKWEEGKEEKEVRSFGVTVSYVGYCIGYCVG
jgi:hypothetical protein